MIRNMENASGEGMGKGVFRRRGVTSHSEICDIARKNYANEIAEVWVLDDHDVIFYCERVVQMCVSDVCVRCILHLKTFLESISIRI